MQSRHHQEVHLQLQFGRVVRIGLEARKQPPNLEFGFQFGGRKSSSDDGRNSFSHQNFGPNLDGKILFLSYPSYVWNMY